jgi:hypothetical protein
VSFRVASDARSIAVCGEETVDVESPDPDALALARGDELLFDADTGVAQLALRGSGCAVWGDAFSPDGNLGDPMRVYRSQEYPPVQTLLVRL